ncbi:MAG: hypothetical protein ACRD3N_01500 [Terracidiphilus sp.]
MRKTIVFAVGGLALLAGCGHQGNSADTIHIQPKWQGTPYHIAFETQATKPNPAGIAIPAIKYTANPDALETRACLVVKFDDSAAQAHGTIMNQLIMGPVDIHGAEGALPADYMDATDKGLAGLLAAYRVKGKVKVSVLLARSSLDVDAGKSEIDENALSDWLTTELVFKNPHPAR